MAYTVEFSARANRDIDEIVARIQADAPIRATQWRKKLHMKLQALITFPESGGLAPENEEARTEVRQLIYGWYRALYTIRGATIYILTIRHGARQLMSSEEMDEL